MFKKAVFIISAILVFVLPLSAYDYGGSLDLSGGAAMAGDFSINSISPSAKVTGWVKAPFTGGSFSTEAYYKINGSFADGRDPTFTQVADLSLMKLTFGVSTGSVSLSMNLGRYAFSDVTSSVYSMTSDGANFAFNAGLLKVNGFLGYTGLLNAKTSGIDAVWSYDSDALYALGSKYTVFLANVSAPNFFGGNTFSAEVIGGVNMNGEAKLGVSDGFSRFYGTVATSGPVSTIVYYSTSVTGSFFTRDTDKLGVYAKGSLVAYIPFKSLSVSVKGAYGSKNFKGISWNPCAGGVLNAGVNATIKPVDSLLCLVSSDIYCNGFEPVSASWNAIIRWQMLSDVSSFISIGQSIPLPSGNSSFSASVGGTLSF